MLGPARYGMRSRRLVWGQNPAAQGHLQQLRPGSIAEHFAVNTRALRTGSLPAAEGHKKQLRRVTDSCAGP